MRTHRRHRTAVSLATAYVDQSDDATTEATIEFPEDFTALDDAALETLRTDAVSAPILSPMSR